MPLSAGTRLGPLRAEGQLGRGNTKKELVVRGALRQAVGATGGGSRPLISGAVVEARLRAWFQVP
jgi:hypothetical protein